MIRRKKRRPWRRKRVFSTEEEGFLAKGGRWGLQTAQMNLNKGNSGRRFNAIAVSIMWCQIMHCGGVEKTGHHDKGVA